MEEEGDDAYRRASEEEGETGGGVWVVVGDSIVRPGHIRDVLGATIRGVGEVRVVGLSGARMEYIGELVRQEVGTGEGGGRKGEAGGRESMG